MDAKFYRAEAERCRRAAADETDAEARRRMLAMAAEYDALAAELGAGDASKRSS
jgi:hypothetical protein